MKAQKLSVTLLTDRKIRNNLLRWYNEATSEEITLGLNWYKEAQDFCKMLSRTFDISTYTAATVVSCLSPNNKWERNKLDAIKVIESWVLGVEPDKVKVCTYKANKLKAFRALKGELIAESAPKTHAFAMNVGNLSSDHVTIDKWHLRACVLSPKAGIKDATETCTAKQYRRVERITSEIAKENNLKGFEIQAIIWVAIKRVWGR